MNAKDQAAMNEVIAQMKEAFALEMKAALQPLVLEINELQQRSSNFAARVSAVHKAYRGEITSLRERIERLEPKPKAPVVPRLSSAEWDAALAELKSESKTGQTFFAPGIVRAKAEAMRAAIECRAEDEQMLDEAECDF